ncbi:MurR/RpiR family transcriptional regulator [Lactovum odontotermitis]
MTIRELAQEVYVSTTTILRLANKLGFEGWTELKDFLESDEIYDSSMIADYSQNIIQMKLFLQKISEKDFRLILEQAIMMIAGAPEVLFLGVGNSNALAQYGARYFVNFGIDAYHISDIFQPILPQHLKQAVSILLSVSGETKTMIDQAMDIKRAGGLIISITNTEVSTLANMADLNISYHMLNEYTKSVNRQNFSLTTQFPVIVLLEILAHSVNKRRAEQTK